VQTPHTSSGNEIRRHASDLRYWDIATEAGWGHSEADRLLDLAALLKHHTESAASPADIAVAWLRPQPESEEPKHIPALGRWIRHLSNRCRQRRAGPGACW
jgi:hypothetical protein